ncbi:MAG: class D beta-lactamase [Rhizobiaceae bacterium]
MVGALIVASTLGATAAPKRIECTLLVDAETGTILLRKGDCDHRASPASTFKVPLAVMGFDAGILTSETEPAWPYQPEFGAPKRDQKTVDPTIWERDSVLWYSQEMTRRLGFAKFETYVSGFSYGNADLSGDPGKDNGLTHAWLASSLRISPDEQAAFIARLLADDLPVSKRAMTLARAVLPQLPVKDGWTVHGKTGSIYLRNGKGQFDRSRPIGWFVGWVEKGDRRIVFARLLEDVKKANGPLGPEIRKRFLSDFPKLIEGVEG